LEPVFCNHSSGNCTRISRDSLLLMDEYTTELKPLSLLRAIYNVIFLSKKDEIISNLCQKGQITGLLLLPLWHQHM
jgi:hypothetical protein